MTNALDLESNEVVADRRGDTPDWVWSPPETAYHETYVELLLDTPNGMRRAVGIYRKGPFWGKTVEGWFAPERISETGRPGHNMYCDGSVKGWRPYRYHLLAADSGEWKPIGTAPRDGSPVLLGYFRANFDGTIYEEGGQPVVARWIDRFAGKSGWVAGRERLNSEGPFSPTHWRHVPAPPEVVAG